MSNLLLISNSTNHGGGYLDHCERHVQGFLGDYDVRDVLFVPYARPDGITQAGYTDQVRDRLKKMGFDVTGIQEEDSPEEAIQTAESVFIGGEGNTFVLLDHLYLYNLIVVENLRERVREGMPYIGTSAGSTVAGMDIGNTSDTPIVYPPSFDALRLVPFNIIPDYLDPDPDSKHQGKTMETQISEFHAIDNFQPVVGLREDSMLHVNDDRIELKGVTGAKVFRRGETPTEHKPGERLDFLLR